MSNREIRRRMAIQWGYLALISLALFLSSAARVLASPLIESKARGPNACLTESVSDPSSQESACRAAPDPEEWRSVLTSVMGFNRAENLGGNSGWPHPPIQRYSD